MYRLKEGFLIGLFALTFATLGCAGKYPGNVMVWTLNDVPLLISERINKVEFTKDRVFFEISKDNVQQVKEYFEKNSGERLSVTVLFGDRVYAEEILVYEDTFLDGTKFSLPWFERSEEFFKTSGIRVIKR